MAQRFFAWRATRRQARGERGATLVEYSLLVAFIAMACVLALGFLGTQTSNGLTGAGSSIFVNP